MNKMCAYQLKTTLTSLYIARPFFGCIWKSQI